MNDHRHGLPHFGDVITGEWTGIVEGHSHIIKQEGPPANPYVWVEGYGEPMVDLHTHEPDVASMMTGGMIGVPVR